MSADPPSAISSSHYSPVAAARIPAYKYKTILLKNVVSFKTKKIVLIIFCSFTIIILIIIAHILLQFSLALLFIFILKIESPILYINIYIYINKITKKLFQIIIKPKIYKKFLIKIDISYRVSATKTML